MVPVVPLFSTQHEKGNTGSFSRIKIKNNVMDKIWYRNPSKSEVIGRCGGDEKKRMTTQNRQKSNTKIFLPSGIKTNSTKMQMDLTIYSNALRQPGCI